MRKREERREWKILFDIVYWSEVVKGVGWLKVRNWNGSEREWRMAAAAWSGVGGNMNNSIPKKTML